MAWNTDFKVKRTIFRGTEYDSVLEADWAATLTMWGIEFVYHPGRIFLSNNDIYEPDFQLDCDMMLEVKGGHNERIDKAWRASTESGIPIVVGRASFLPAGTNMEYAGAVWEPEEIAVVNVGSRVCFSTDVPDVEQASWSAMWAYARGLSGIRMFKAVGDNCV